MKNKWKQWMKKHPTACLLGACYAVFFVGLVLLHLGLLVVNRVGYQNGTFTTGNLAPDDFALEGMEQIGDVLITTTTDPQMLLRDTGRKIDTVLLDFKYSQDPYLVNVLYARSDADYSVENMAYPQNTGEGQWFLLPAGGGERLRIDPGSIAGNRITVNHITVNQPRPFWEFFRFSALEWTLLLVLPGLAACVVSVVLEARRALGARKEARP